MSDKQQDADERLPNKESTTPEKQEDVIPEIEKLTRDALKQKVSICANPFEIIDACADSLGQVLQQIEDHDDAEGIIIEVCNSIIQACESNTDATLGAVHISHKHPYSCLHPIYTAVLSYVLCRALDLTANEIENVLAAALTSNIAMLDLQEELQQQTTALSDEQKAKIEAHPKEGIKILKSCGIKNQDWLDIVHQHHERANGDSYPEGLTGDQIVIGAKILALADVYSAMISPRSYRESMEASDALKSVFMERGKECDETLAILLIKRMGVFPPGCYVNLKSGEIAIVVQRTEDPMKPKVVTLLNPAGRAYVSPVCLTTDTPEHHITGAAKHLEPDEVKVELHRIWGYD